MRQHRKSFRTSLTVAAVAAATAVVLAPSITHAAGGSHGSAAKPASVTHASTTRTMAIGADLKPTGGQSDQQAITSFEAATGHKVTFTRDYLLWNSPFPTSYEQWLGTHGTVPLISVNPKTLSGGAVSWSSVANAKPGSAVYTQMKAWADEIKAYGYPVYFIYNHEPEAASSSSFGTAADYIAAWQNFHNVFVTEGVTNAKWMWTMTSFAFIVPTTDRRYAWKWYPGDAYVDAIGADAYTAYTCDNPSGVWHPLSYQLTGFVTFGSQHPTKPMWLPEWGVVEDTHQAGRKAQWITDAEALFKGSAYSQFVGIAYFNETRPGTACDWRITTSSSASAAYGALAQDPFYNGVPTPPTGDTTPPTVSVTSPADSSTQSGTIAVTANANDDNAVASVAFAVDGNVVSTSTSAPYAATIDTTALSNGSHALTAIATDTAGNSTTSDTVHITVSNVVTPSGCSGPAPGSTELSGNLSLESNQSGWTGVYSATSLNTRVQVSGGSYDGNWALQIGPKSGTTGTDGVNNVSPTWVPGSPGLGTSVGTNYVGSAEVRASAPGQVVNLMLRELTPSGAGVSYATTTMTLNDTAWHSITSTYVAKNAGDSIHYSIYATFSTSSKFVQSDCMSLQSS